MTDKMKPRARKPVKPPEEQHVHHSKKPLGKALMFGKNLKRTPYLVQRATLELVLVCLPDVLKNLGWVRTILIYSGDRIVEAWSVDEAGKITKGQDIRLRYFPLGKPQQAQTQGGSRPYQRRDRR